MDQCFVRPRWTLLFSCLLTGSLACGQSDDTTANPPDDPVPLRPEVVTAASAGRPLELVLDAKAPVQPIPAQDGADYLKSVPGFSVIRKGGTDGDPVLRGMAGSRLRISLDGQTVLGGCNMRMDPPTAYVFPAAYDRLRVLKGPQTVLYGPGNSAGVVVFESDPPDFVQAGYEGHSSATVGSFGRLDLAADVTAGSPEGFARTSVVRSESEDYEDGGGHEVHAGHMRWSANAAVGWTPDTDTVLQFTATVSDGEAAYADRMMDGASFDRESYSLNFRRENLSPWIDAVEVEAGYNYVDHVMDNYSLRSFAPTMMMPNPMATNTDRRTVGGKALLELSPLEPLGVTLGMDHQQDRHRSRSSMNAELMSYEGMAWQRDADFSQWGLFGEAAYALTDTQRVVVGARVDRWEAEDHRDEVRAGMMSTLPNPTAGAERDDALISGFARYELELPDSPTTFYAGLGHTERFLDYWELFSNESTMSVSAFDLDPEKTTQLDLGATHQLGPVALNVSAFYSQIDDFALVENGFEKAGVMGTRAAVVTRNVDAHTWGGEAGAAWKIDAHWLVDASLAYVRGTNETDDRPLGQIPPLESRLRVTYRQDTWSLGTLLRGVAEQDRVAVGQGNIVGQDIGESPGFVVLSVHGAWRLTDFARLTAGIDNLTDATYAEHISRAGAAVAGYPQTTRVNEPGRTLWARFDFSF
ncbi:MAG: iron complex outermembrane recepter protein [Puniceicoccaceae bacterium 5H]|nr:MAG: iron complex outermembrane recepter protein [Puniceicoccaceae bacterium 5H]